MAADGEEELVAQRVTDVRICHQRRGDSSVVYLVRGVVDVFLDPSPRETPGLGFPVADGEIPVSSHLWGITSAGWESVWLQCWAAVSACFSHGDQDGAMLHLQHQQQRVSKAWCSGVLTSGVT
jgi:hypothetical protein